jgi:putative tryptophan/tyrosine transport system substrate-binding protein
MIQVGIIVAGSVCPIEGFKSRLRDLGWVEGKGISFQVRAAEGQLRLLPQFAEMVNLGVDLIAVIGAVTVRSVRQATSRCLRWLSSRSVTDWPRTWSDLGETSQG